MYRPIQPGIDTALKDLITYTEQPEGETSPALCFWQLKTTGLLAQDFSYLVLPDGCLDIVVDLNNPGEAIVMSPATKATSINLGKNFNFIGVRLKPGAWLADADQVVQQGATLLREFGISQSFNPKSPMLALKQVLSGLQKKKIVADDNDKSLIPSYSYSSRHYRRVFKKRVGFSRQNFNKIVRFQRALAKQSFADYSDQSHFIRDFKSITGYTPNRFFSKFSV